MVCYAIQPAYCGRPVAMNTDLSLVWENLLRRLGVWANPDILAWSLRQQRQYRRSC